MQPDQPGEAPSEFADVSSGDLTRMATGMADASIYGASTAPLAPAAPQRLEASPGAVSPVATIEPSPDGTVLVGAQQLRQALQAGGGDRIVRDLGPDLPYAADALSVLPKDVATIADSLGAFAHGEVWQAMAELGRDLAGAEVSGARAVLRPSDVESYARAESPQLAAMMRSDPGMAANLAVLSSSLPAAVVERLTAMAEDDPRLFELGAAIGGKLWGHGLARR